jgi:hypothetical protein
MSETGGFDFKKKKYSYQNNSPEIRGEAPRISQELKVTY